MQYNLFYLGKVAPLYSTYHIISNSLWKDISIIQPLSLKPFDFGIGTYGTRQDVLGGYVPSGFAGNGISSNREIPVGYSYDHNQVPSAFYSSGSLSGQRYTELQGNSGASFNGGQRQNLNKGGYRNDHESGKKIF